MIENEEDLYITCTDYSQEFPLEGLENLTEVPQPGMRMFRIYTEMWYF